MRSIIGGQIARLVAGEDPLWVGDAPGRGRAALHPLLDRVVTHLISAMGRAFGGGDPDESVALARLACAVGEDAPHADVCAAVLELLDLYREHLAPPPPGRPFPLAGALPDRRAHGRAHARPSRSRPDLHSPHPDGRREREPTPRLAAATLRRRR